MSIRDSVNTILTDVGVEIGLTEVTDPFADTDPGWKQLRTLLKTTGRELIHKAQFRDVVKEHSITTDAASDTGDYDLPSDFLYMVPQTNWNRTDKIQVFGPRTPQQWQYSIGRGLSSQTLYITFRLQNKDFRIYPNDPVPDAVSIVFEYVSDQWITNAAEDTDAAWATDGTDLVKLPTMLVNKLLKAKFLEAKGFDSVAARQDFNEMWETITGQDLSAPILNVGGGGGSELLLDGMHNVPDTGYGS